MPGGSLPPSDRVLLGQAAVRGLRIHLLRGFIDCRGYDRPGRSRLRTPRIRSAIQAMVPASAAARASTSSSRFAAIIASAFLKFVVWLSRPSSRSSSSSPSPRLDSSRVMAIRLKWAYSSWRTPRSVRPWNSSTAIMILDVL